MNEARGDGAIESGVFHVTVSFEGEWWMARVAELPGVVVPATSLPELDEMVRGAIMMSIDPGGVRPLDSMVVAYDYGGLSRLLQLAANAGAQRARIVEAGVGLKVLLRAAKTALVDEGYSFADISRLLGLSTAEVARLRELRDSDGD
ncbi:MULTISPECIES: hypothetical protein [Micrococcales]|uniref:Transcriptional regulator n=2 Tax=Micrococcales TaxID=85006 RepID=A0AAW8NH18_PSEOX|nr:MULTISPECIES: hypothetical protein [Micrococcales]MDJ1370173.1 hypothetical protein [Gulosibacter molinativorax]MDR7165640.1 hypothetical protein [Pseudarthrobacter oxydans]QUY61583.1 Hypotetical protein [Gulosibacter molinativorax]